MELRKGYKQTEVDLIPEDWDIKPLKILTNLIIDGTHLTPKYKEFGVPFLRVTDVQSLEIDFDRIKFISVEEHRFLTRRCRPERGDLLLSKNGTIGIPKVVTWDWEFSIFVSLALLKPKDKLINIWFLEQFFKSDYLKEQIQKRSKQGTVTNLHLEEIREFLIPLPPLPEQNAIAAALSDVDALLNSLDALIAKKYLIKQGAMQELLTGKKRLSRFSGEKWNKKRLGDTATLKARIGWQGLTTAEYLDAGDYYLITGTDFKDGFIDWDNCHYVDEVRYIQDKYIQVKNHDVLVTKDGTIGKVALITNLTTPATLNSGVFVIRPIEDAFHPEFFYYLLCSNIFTEFLGQLLNFD